MLQYEEFEEKFGEYDQWQFLLLRIYENIEQSIQIMENLKAEDYKDIATLNARENSMTNMIWIITFILLKVNNATDFIFPYFDQLLELTYNPLLLNSLTRLALYIAPNEESHDIRNTHLSCLISFYTPFVQFSSHFKYEHHLMADAIKEAFKTKNEHQIVPEALDNLLLVVFDQKEEIVQILKEHYINKGIENRTLLISEVSKSIQERYEVTKDKDPSRYYSIIGQVTSAAFLIDEKLDEGLFPLILLAQCLTGISLSHNSSKYHRNPLNQAESESRCTWR